MARAEGHERAARAEAQLLPLPPAVEFWLQPAEELETCGDEALASQARAAMGWLERALRCMHGSARVKAAVRELLSVGDFTLNLGVFGVFDELRASCQAAADDLGAELRAFYESAGLRESLGRFRSLAAREPPVLRQDAPGVGVPVPPRQEGRTPLQRENVVLHMLLLLSRALDPGFQDAILAMAGKHRGRHRGAPTKGHARMMNKAVSKDDHRYRDSPVVMHNIDLVRCAVTFDDVEDLKSMLNDLEDSFGAPARDKNMFAYSDSKAAEQLHYRTFMRNLIYAPEGLTYAKLAEQSEAVWRCYLEDPPEDPNEPWARFRADATRAVEFLRSAEVADRPVRLVCEVQCLLQTYLDGRMRMHGLYKVIRAPDEHALYSDFKKSCAAHGEGATWTGMQQQALEEVRRLVDEDGQSVNSVWGIDSMTLLHSAADQGHTWAVKWLLGRRADVGVATADDGATPLYLAVENGHLDTVQVLLAWDAGVDAATTSRGNTPLSAAASHGDVDVAQLLLAARAEPNAAAHAGHTPLWRAAHGGHMDVVQVLLGAAADVSRARTADACTPLLAAAESGCADVVSVLLAAAADAHRAKTDDGVAPLSMAAFKGHADVVGALLQARAAADTATAEGKTPLYLAAESGHVAVVEALLAGFARVDRATPDDGTSPLYVAAQNGHEGAVRALLRGRAPVDQATTDDGATPLWAAAERGHTEAVALLLGSRAGVDRSLTTDGSTPLFMAAYGGHAGAARLLLAARADPVRPCRGFGTALQAAQRQGRGEAAAVLEAVDGSPPRRPPCS
mmetsp:Transcript_21133/g.66824  ORF Transcript_21133/g.66824 Transcript_21133/m.66824 type:complete len:792 (+) Transcript_21133:62-2437(+)